MKDIIVPDVDYHSEVKKCKTMEDVVEKNGLMQKLFKVSLLMTCGDARLQPLFFLITTAGTDRNSICFEQHQKHWILLLLF